MQNAFVLCGKGNWNGRRRKTRATRGEVIGILKEEREETFVFLNSIFKFLVIFFPTLFNFS